MPCPYCGSYATSVGNYEDGDEYERCHACGAFFTGEDYDSDQEDDHCDHEWRTVSIAGEACDECVKCGAIDC